ncbi:acetyl-CoA synthetase-like protein [Apiospora hydei]|uniref:Acetyl-CoA synthetase-like protein n=1 Tax=Apiospora hydei TaxID=1337664 RepID=A0ABR1WWY0_9PEZI
MEMPFHVVGEDEPSLQGLLEARAATKQGNIICYPLGDTSTPIKVSYLDFYMRAIHLSRIVRHLPSFQDRHPILLYFHEHWENIVWFWAVMLANGVPVLSPSFSSVEEHRHQHIRGLSKLLEHPICITHQSLLHLFAAEESLLQLHTVESLSHEKPALDPSQSIPVMGSPPECLAFTGGQSLAMLMLTSGSTGNAKAVCITHRQVFAAISGKASVRPLNQGQPYLNWIDLNHVASLVEIHIQALWLGVDQIHVCAPDVVSSPTLFLDLLSQYKVSRTFAPNFFLGHLASALESRSYSDSNPAWDLSGLQLITSGGEANDVNTTVATSLLLQRYGAKPNVIAPGFGMTETCAGAIFNLSCPRYDVEQGHSIASLGKCMKGIDMRIIANSGLATPGEIGDLEVSGDVVFEGYYRNPVANADAFPSNDGWFRTGDQAYINSDGHLCLLGRKKDVININGVKIASSDIELAIEQTLGLRVKRFVVFPSRALHTEQITICYVPDAWPHGPKAMAEIEEMASQACIAGFSAIPLVFSLREASLPSLPTSALGKISRAKMSSLFEKSVFDEDVSSHKQVLDDYRRRTELCGSVFSPPTGIEAALIDDFAQTVGRSHEAMGPETRLFELGFTSMDLIRLKRRIDTRLGIKVPLIVLMKNPTARTLASALARDCYLGAGANDQPKSVAVLEYDPIVTLKDSGKKTPLWLVHPGVGEALVFVGLAQQLADDDRPVYALRARGFEGQAAFSCIDEVVTTYVQAIQQRQKEGPYALAGYSYGAMLAFEIAKKLDAIEKSKSKTVPAVRFLGSFNLPPHIKSRMKQLSWNKCLLHLTFFLGLTSEEYAEKTDNAEYSAADPTNALAEVVRASNPARMVELGLDDVALARWTDVAYGLQSMAVAYEPCGQVDAIDVFHAIPLKAAAASREEWVSDHLSKWRDFSKAEPRYHAVGGAHYTLIGPDHVVMFSKNLKMAMEARGV